MVVHDTLEEDREVDRPRTLVETSIDNNETPVRKEKIRGLRGKFLWILGTTTILTINLIWAFLDSSPPIWDMAHHQLMGWMHLESLQAGESLIQLNRISDYYPPLYYLMEVFVIRFLSETEFLAFLVNLPGLLLMSFFTFKLAEELYDSKIAAVSGLLVLMFPLVAWTGRETLLDPWLSGWVATALYCMVRSHFFAGRGWALVFGLVVAAGMLTKWTFLIFLAPGVVYALIQGEGRRRSLLHFLDSVLIAAPAILWWYLPNLDSLIHRFRMTTQGAVSEQDPTFMSLLGLVYYPRSIASYYLFLPLAIVFCWSFYHFLVRRMGNSTGRLVMVTLLGSVVLLTVLEAKDPRYVMPAVAVVAIVLVSGLEKRRRVMIGVVVIAFVQFVAVSFYVPYLPEKISFFSLEDDSDYISMRQELVLFETGYFGVVGRPASESWRYDEILDRIGPDDQVGFVPDAPFFNPTTLQVMGRHQGKRIEVYRIGLSEQFRSKLEESDWVIGKSGSQGISYITQFNRDVYEALETLDWPLVDEWDLPDRTKARLWRKPTRSQ